MLLALLANATLFALIFYERYLIQGLLDNFTLLLLAGAAFGALLSALSLALLRTRHGDKVRRAWLGLVASALTCALVDLAAGRALNPPLSPALIGDETVHHRLAPDTYSEIQHVNSLGLRGPDVERQKPPGTWRIALLGDSFIMGKGVADDQTAAHRLEKRLRRDGHRVEVINGGVASYAPILSLLQLRTLLARLSLDLVVFNIDMGDLLQEEAYRARARHDEAGRLVGVDGRRDRWAYQRARNWIVENLYVGGLLVHHLQRRAPWLRRRWGGGLTVSEVVAFANPAIIEHTLASDRQDRGGQWRTLFDSVLAARDFSAARGIELVLAIYPWGHQVNAREWTPGRLDFVPEDAVISDRSLEHVRRLAAQHGIELLDTFPAFRAWAGEAPLYWSFDLHWTPAGHDLYARELQRLIARRLTSMGSKPAPGGSPGGTIGR